MDKFLFFSGSGLFLTLVGLVFLCYPQTVFRYRTLFTVKQRSLNNFGLAMYAISGFGFVVSGVGLAVYGAFSMSGVRIYVVAILICTPLVLGYLVLYRMWE